MKLSAADFKQCYAAMSNLELAQIKKEDLEDVARECYEHEVAARRTGRPIEADPHARGLGLGRCFNQSAGEAR